MRLQILWTWTIFKKQITGMNVERAENKIETELQQYQTLYDRSRWIKTTEWTPNNAEPFKHTQVNTLSV